MRCLGWRWWDDGGVWGEEGWRGEGGASIAGTVEMRAMNEDCAEGCIAAGEQYYGSEPRCGFRDFCPTS